MELQSQTPTSIPARCDVVIVGGGPAGSSTAGYLAKAGLDVVLFDKVTHPRPQVGESTIPHMWRLTDNLGVSDKILQNGFLPKAGGITVWDGRIRLLRFTDFGYPDRGGLHVERDRFDDLLLRHAQGLGARVFEDIIARGVDFSTPGAPRLTYEDRRLGAAPGERVITARYVIDASGPSAMLAKQLNARHVITSDRKYLGLWGYFTGSNFFSTDGRMHGQDEIGKVKPVTFVSSYEDGWIWHIILRNEASVGFAMSTDRTKGMNKKEQEEYFLATCKRVPYLKELLKDARFIEGTMAFRPDYSYYSEKVVGDDFFCVGDAAAFVDPIFSQGVLGCLFHGSLAAWAITESLANPSRKRFYQEIFENRVLQYYGFSRLLALGHFDAGSVDPHLVRQFVRSLPKNEVELVFAASWSTDRSENLTRMAREAGLDADALVAKLHPIELVT